METPVYKVRRRFMLKSSTLASVGYDLDAQVLEVEFIAGAVYCYQNVTPEIYCRLLNSPSERGNSLSIGQYFVDEIKKQPDKYPFTRVPS